MSNWTNKLICRMMGHDYETKLVMGPKTVKLGEDKFLSHTYNTITDVKLVCKCCGLVADREVIVNK